jgi:hypothetical protein
MARLDWAAILYDTQTVKIARLVLDGRGRSNVKEVIVIGLILVLQEKRLLYISMDSANYRIFAIFRCS